MLRDLKLWRWVQTVVEVWHFTSEIYKTLPTLLTLIRKKHPLNFKSSQLDKSFNRMYRTFETKRRNDLVNRMWFLRQFNLVQYPKNQCSKVQRLLAWFVYLVYLLDHVNVFDVTKSFRFSISMAFLFTSHQTTLRLIQKNIKFLQLFHFFLAGLNVKFVFDRNMKMLTVRDGNFKWT